MTSRTKAIDDFIALSPRQFRVMKSVTISQGDNQDGVYEQRVSLVLIKDVDSVSESLILEFEGVRALAFHQPEFSVVNIALDITRSDDMGCAYVVRDIEQERVISFECSGFEAFIA